MTSLAVLFRLLVFFYGPFVSGSYLFGAGLPEECIYAFFSVRFLPETSYSALSGSTVGTYCVSLQRLWVILRRFTPAFADEVVAALVVDYSGLAGFPGDDDFFAACPFVVLRPKRFGILAGMTQMYSCLEEDRKIG